MKKQMKFKLLVMFCIIIGAIFLFRTNKVEAKTFEYEYDYRGAYGKFTIEIENNKLTKVDTYFNTITEVENFEDIIGVENSNNIHNALIMKQENINKFNTSRDMNYTIKKKIANDVTSVKAGDGTELEIQTINNEKWFVYHGIIHYDAINDTTGSYIIGYKNNDISKVGMNDIVYYYENNNTDNKKYIYVTFEIVTERIANQKLFISSYLENKKDYIEYDRNINVDIEDRYEHYMCPIGHYQMLNPIYSTDADTYKRSENDTMFGNKLDYFKLPTNVNPEDIYLSIWIKDNYQGEKIELENNKGTLYFKEKKHVSYTELEKVNYYIYEGKLSDLKLKENEVGLIKLKLKDGSEIPKYITCTYNYDENTKEKIIDYRNKPKKEQNIEDKVKVGYYIENEMHITGFNFLKLEEDNLLYNSVKNEMDKKSINYDNLLYTDMLDVYEEYGNSYGEKTLTFNVGEQYNGKYYNIVHRIRYNEFENFEGIVEDGKIEITTDSLSPFGISIYESKAINSEENNEENENKENNNNNQQEDKGEKDNTPKTGNKDIVGYISIITIISMIGILIIKRKLK